MAIIRVKQPKQKRDVEERKWRDEELLRTDKLIILPDFPKDLRQYRKDLRDYPNQADFPNGKRPVEE